MVSTSLIHPMDPPELRKVRGAFLTPPDITEFVAKWAIQASGDRVLEPSAGDAAFPVAAVARQRVREAGGKAHVRQIDFFDVAPEPASDAAIGNPPYIRYQNFSGEARAKSRQAALRGRRAEDKQL